MYFAHARCADDGGGITGVDATAGEDDNPPGCLLLDGLQRLNTLKGSGLLSGGQDPMEAAPDNLFQRFRPVGTAVEGTVEGDLHAACGFHCAAAMVGVHTAVLMEEADHHARCPDVATVADVVQYGLHLIFRVAEVAAARTYQHEGFERQGVNTVRDVSAVGGEAAQIKPAAQFDTRRAGTVGLAGRVERGGTYLQQRLAMNWVGEWFCHAMG